MFYVLLLGMGFSLAAGDPIWLFCGVMCYLLFSGNEDEER